MEITGTPRHKASTSTLPKLSRMEVKTNAPALAMTGKGLSMCPASVTGLREARSSMRFCSAACSEPSPRMVKAMPGSSSKAAASTKVA
ncbi:hypothetical protein D9M68_1001440 [compost metagenome]